MDQHLEHRFRGISAKDFWELFFFDEAYGKAIHAHLEVEVVEMSIQCEGVEQAPGCKRQMAIKPAQQAPGFVSKLISGSAIVREHSHLDMQAGTMTTCIVLPTIGKRVDYGGTYTWREADDGFVRIWDGHCKARFPLIAGKMERFFLGELEKSLTKAQAFTQRWIDERR
jgi:hypothetical protein